LYEDDGLTLDYKKGKFAKTPFIHKIDKNGKSFVEIGPTKGSYTGQVEKRSYTLHIPRVTKVKSVEVNKITLAKDQWTWIKDRSILAIEVGKTNIGEPVKIEIK
jgi:hypothetical protein